MKSRVVPIITPALRTVLKLLTWCALLAFLGCDQSFNPRISGASSPVVYSILATDKADQFVKVYTTYPASIPTPSANTAEYPITDAFVTISDGVSTIVLTDTLLTRIDSTRYSGPFHAYVTSGFTLNYGTHYLLQIQSPSTGTLTSTVSIPQKPFISISGGQVLQKPQQYALTQKIQTTAIIPPGAKAFIFRMVISYDVFEGTAWVRKREEIPARFRSDLITLENAIYGEVTRIQSSTVGNVYTVLSYQTVLDAIYERTKPYKLVFNFVIVQFVQMDEGLYNYYSNVKGFQDPFSIRLDQSNYSNITNGEGLFAAYSVDSLFQIIPLDFLWNRR